MSSWSLVGSHPLTVQSPGGNCYPDVKLICLISKNFYLHQLHLFADLTISKNTKPGAYVFKVVTREGSADLRFEIAAPLSRQAPTPSLRVWDTSAACDDPSR